jgi:hypothetical protein
MSSNPPESSGLASFPPPGRAASLAIIKLAQSPQSRKAALENSAAHQNAVDRFNSVLAQIQLLDAGEVYEAAHRVNECLVHLGREAAARRADGSTWRATRADLSNAVAAYQQAARKALGAKAIQGHEPWRKHDLGTRSLQAAFTPRRLRRWWLIP